MTLPEEIWQDIGHSPPPCDPGHENKDEKKKYEEDMLKYKENKNELMLEAWKAYKAEAKTPNPKRPIQTKLPNSTLVLSLTYDVIRGNIKGSLGMNVDEQLNLKGIEQGRRYIEKMGERESA